MPTILLLVFTLALYIVPVEASPNYRALISEGNNLARSEMRFRKRLSQLSSADRERVKSKLARKGRDSDRDGVGDLYEKARGSDLCDSDSDDDGASDNDDNFENDDDKFSEVSTTGRVISFDDSASLLVVGGKTFTLNDSTLFRRITRAGLTAGACVEVEGYVTTGGITVAKKVQREDSCGSSGDDDDSDDD